MITFTCDRCSKRVPNFNNIGRHKITISMPVFNEKGNVKYYRKVMFEGKDVCKECSIEIFGEDNSTTKGEKQIINFKESIRVNVKPILEGIIKIHTNYRIRKQ